MVNNIIAEVNAYKGANGSHAGHGGDGGNGGSGGSGGTPGTDGLGGDGGDGGKGGEGGLSGPADLIYAVDTNFTLTNNPLYHPVAADGFPAGGGQGGGGNGGTGSVSGSAGSHGSAGDIGSAGVSHGLNNMLSTIGVFNNIFVGAGGLFNRGINQGTSSTITTDYNNVVGFTTPYQGLSAGPNDISVDPLFVNPAEDNFNLQAGSPCIDAGDNSVPGRPLVDHDGNDRPFDGDGDGTADTDMGAYEFGSGTYEVFLPLIMR